jgi:hypothetical protein
MHYSRQSVSSKWQAQLNLLIREGPLFSNEWRSSEWVGPYLRFPCLFMMWWLCKETNLLSNNEKSNVLWYYSYAPTALCLALAIFSVSWSYTQSVGLLGWGISPSQGLYLHIEQHKHRINAHYTDKHAMSGIRTHNLRVRAIEDSPCLRQRGHCDRIIVFIIHKNFWK